MAQNAHEAGFGISPGGNANTELRAKHLRSAREIGRQVECPYRIAGKASALGAGRDIPKSAYSRHCVSGCCGLECSLIRETLAAGRAQPLTKRCAPFIAVPTTAGQGAYCKEALGRR